jgi:hypothetical protein
LSNAVKTAEFELQNILENPRGVWSDGEFNNTSYLEEVATKEREITTLKKTLEKEVNYLGRTQGKDFNFNYLDNFKDIYEASIEHARLNTRRTGRMIYETNGEDITLFTVDAELESSPFFDAFTLEMLDFIDPFASMFNLAQIPLIYFSIADLRIHLTLSEINTATQYAFNNPNLKSMITYYTNLNAREIGRNIYTKTLREDSSFKETLTAQYTVQSMNSHTNITSNDVQSLDQAELTLALTELKNIKADSQEQQGSKITVAMNAAMMTQKEDEISTIYQKN